MNKATKQISKLFAAMVLAGVAGHSFAADTIKIGIAGPKTGPVTQYGDMQFMGAKQAIADINAKGGVDGKQLVAVEYDDACDPKQAVAVANKVVNDGVKFVVGHLCSSSTQPASDIYEDEGVIMITPAATSPEITARGYKLIFRTIGLDSAQGPAAGNYIADHVKPKIVAVLHDKQQYGEGIATAVKQTLEKKGVKVAVFEGLNAGDKDFSSIIQKLKQANVDFVYYGGYHPELGLILRQSKEKGLNAKFMGPEGVGNDSISQIAQGASEGLLVTLPKSFDTDPANKAIVEEFAKNKQDPTGPFVFPAYSAVEVIAGGITAAKSEDTAKVAAAIHAGTFKTPTGELSFDAKGDLKDFKFVVYEWHFGKPKTEVSPQ
ncbi:MULTISPECIES: branched-chain amino acid ABC transporter substrate-binding protein [Pseudomonas]|jgi:branched-chain amino acid transport system substrate-binding protein|uniref:Branched-chain amino acid ABC transporter, periplasmic branched-chain amino acid-binding protein BraC n=2 Tax=Pseudomonas fluorescens TaxID=294 RepID=A0A1T2ZS97_PSEFL|nr:MULTISPECIES: branched-chain amino acid ABC transporter substrate-binding protein [Pseudomonas]MEA3170020.1 branched-chain amino acid transport system substrate-binding protein [Pseudomonas sp.]MBC8784792.1 branched-chain amino acid ABC transporter substrate-binding protein [Pseudomonas fluorescens]MBK5544939.1 branched-chain amino acid ABC transporter substrate-binding protein [Pseudomonas sp. TH04]MCI4605215.1 branched-chain amino acid ABC transporter substrate-binding protein [Pseudomonas